MRYLRAASTGLLLGIFLSGCATSPPGGGGLEPQSLKDLCSRHGVSLIWDTVTQVATLNKNGLKARVLVGSEVVLMGAEKILLSAPVRRVHSALVVPSDFKRKVIDRFGEADVTVIKKIREVVIDPGHGGKDPGAQGRGGLNEKTIVLDIAKRLKRNLADKGINVIMTRDSDVFISLKERTEITCRSRADLFISIHANASRTRNAQGFEVYYLRNMDSLERTDADLRDNHRIAFKRFLMTDSPAVQAIIADMLYNYKQTESKRLAGFISDNATYAVNTENRGTKSSGFFVLRNTLIPAILVEVGFLSNPQEEGLLKTSSYRQKIADGLAKSILDYAKHGY